ncbi:MAG: hypothetical protein C0467_17555 [Planctomycetaceae bacterium]|nr:hypothetical protein [Planctomycetaceae bacterium]
MSRDGARKRALLSAWWEELLPLRTYSLFSRGEIPDPDTVLVRLATVPDVLSIYVLFARDQGELIPVYVGKSNGPKGRWQAHISALVEGVGGYAKWRAQLLESDGRAAHDLVLLVVQEDAITRPPKAGFPCTVGAVEYQLVGLAADAFPGRLLNDEGQGR